MTPRLSIAGLLPLVALVACAGGAGRLEDAASPDVPPADAALPSDLIDEPDAGPSEVGGADATTAETAAAPVTPTACRDLNAQVRKVVAAARSPVFLNIATFGASVISADDGRVLRTFTGHVGKVQEGAIDADGDRAATIGADDHKLRVWTTKDGRQTLQVDVQAGTGQVLLSPAGDALAVTTARGTLLVLDAATGAEKWRRDVGWIPAPSVGPSVMAAGPVLWPKPEALLVTVAGGWSWVDSGNGQDLSRLASPVSPKGPIALSPDGRLLAIADPVYHGAQVLDAISGEVAQRFGGLEVKALAFSATGDRLFVSDVGLWVNALSSSQPQQLFDWSGPDTMALSSDGQILAGASGLFMRWRISDGQRLESLSIAGGERAAFAPNSHLAITLYSQVETWDPATGTRLHQVPGSVSNTSARTVLFSRSGRLLVNRGRDATFFDPDQNTPVLQFTYEPLKPPDGSDYLRLSPDEMWLVGPGTQDGSLRYWDASNGKLLRTVQMGRDHPNHLVLSPDGKLVAFVRSGSVYEAGPLWGSSPVIELWDTSTDLPVASLKHRTDVSAYAFSWRGDQMVSTDRSGLVRIWSLPGGDSVRDLVAGSEPVDFVQFDPAFLPISAVFSPDDKKVAVLGEERPHNSNHRTSIRILTVQDGRPVLTLPMVEFGPTDHGTIDWSPDGKTLLATVPFEGIRTWCMDEMSME